MSIDLQDNWAKDKRKDHKEKIRSCGKTAPYCGAPSGRMLQRVKVPNPPDSGKDIAKSKGVLGNWESEGSWRQITGLTNRNHEG